MIYSKLGSSYGGCGVPNDRHKVADPTAHGSQSLAFAFANGSRQGGFYGSTSTACISTAKKPKSGWYDGAGRYHED